MNSATGGSVEDHAGTTDSRHRIENPYKSPTGFPVAGSRGNTAVQYPGRHEQIISMREDAATGHQDIRMQDGEDPDLESPVLVHEPPVPQIAVENARALAQPARQRRPLKRSTILNSELDLNGTKCSPRQPSSHEDRYIRLWGKYGLLNNRIRCLANAIAFSRRVNARVVLSEQWEQFAASALDLDWLKKMESGIIITKSKWPTSGDAKAANQTLSISCSDVFWCGGVCDRDKAAVSVLERSWGVMDWKHLRSGGQAKKSRSKRQYELSEEPTLCGYAALLPKPDVRARVRTWAQDRGWFDDTKDKAVFVVGHHQRLQTTVIAEPVSLMCFASAKLILQEHYADAQSPGANYYNTVCPGSLTPDALLSASEAESHVFDKKRKLFLASDRFLANVSNMWQASPLVQMYEQAEDVDPFHTTLGKALYSSSFKGGATARRSALETQSALVYADMLLLVAAHEFWPTPGSTMSNTICFWRKVWNNRDVGVPSLRSCEEIVYGWK